jgi:thioredoxin reductase (NADPH)
MMTSFLMSSSVEKIVIVGTGSAGLTAAVYSGRANLSPLLLEGTLPGGQLTTTSDVENFPGFPEGIDGFQLMDNLRKQAARFGARFEQARVESVDFSGRPLRLRTGEREILARTVIIATGASPRLMGVPGEKEYFGGKGVTTCATCDGAFYRNMDVVVVGGGDSACEEALFLTRFASKVTLIHRRDTLRASKIMAERTLAHPKIQPAWNSVLAEVLGTPAGGVDGVKVKDAKTGAERVIPCKGVFMAIGHVPNTQPFAHALDVDENGYFLAVCGSQVKTNVPDVFVAGDCADHVYRQAITAAGMGCQAAIEAERWLAEHGA